MITHCDICGSKLKTFKKLKFKHVIGMADDYTQHIAFCPHCKLILTANPFSEEQLNKRYKHFSKYEFDAKTYTFSVSDEYRQRCAAQKFFIEEHFSDLASMFEVGASSGYNLSLYNGLKRLGIEPSQTNCENARQNYGVDMFCGVFEEYYRQQIARTDRPSFDMVFLSHTLEHIVNPCSFIRQCVEIVNPRYFFIDVPSFDIKFINEPYGMFCDEHVNYFTLESLDHMMREVGFELADAKISIDVPNRTVAGVPSVLTLWKKSDRPAERRYLNSVSHILKTYLRTSGIEMKRVKKIINGIHSEKLAVWGTGNQLSKLLANTSLLKKHIVKFYDSDTKKHAFKIAGKPIQAFDPKDLEDGIVDTILIATYSAQATLLRLLEPYRDKCHIVTLYD